MGTVRVTARIGKDRGQTREVEFLVDTGAFYTILSPALCRELDIALPPTQRVVTADSRAVDMPLGLAYIEINGRGAGIPVGSLKVPMPLLGVSALEALGFKVNPVDGSMEPTRPFPEIPAL